MVIFFRKSFVLFFCLFLLFSVRAEETLIDNTTPQVLKLKKGKSCLEKGKYKQALEYVYAAYSLYSISENKEKQAECLSLLSEVYFYLRSYDLSLTHGFQALEFYDHQSNEIKKVEILNTLGLVLTSQRKYQLAEKLLNDALEICSKYNYPIKKNHTLNNLSSLYFYQEYFDKSIEIDFEVLEIAILNKDSISIAAAYNNIGTNFSAKKELDSALVYYKRSLSIVNELGEIQRQAVTLGNIGDIFFEKGLYKKSYEFYSKSLPLAIQVGDRIIILGGYKRLSNYYEKQNDFKQSFEYLKKYSSLKDSIDKEKNNQRITELRLINEIDKQKKELKIHKSKIKTLHELALYEKRVKKWMVLFIIALFFFLILLVYRVRQNKKISKQQDMILQQKEIINNKLKNDIDMKRRQLSSISLHIFHKSEVLSKVLDEIKGKKGMPFQNIRKIIEEHLSLDSDWNEFQKLFTEVHPLFFSNLADRHPELSKTDFRHCAYIKMRMTTKEIASLFSISPSSVQIARVRLKKKLKLPKEIDLQKYIQEIETK